jgi:RNA polymerase sigma factor (sigma-70 family)
MLADLNRIAQQHRPKLYLRALRLTRDPDGAHDLLQDTFERCLRRLPDHLADEGVLPWIFVVMRNLYLDRVRQAANRLVCQDVDTFGQTSAIDLEDEPRWQRVNLREVRSAVKSLPDHLRLPYEMHVFRKLPYQDIAKHLHLAAPTVGTRIHRARLQLRRRLLAALGPS